MEAACRLGGVLDGSPSASRWMRRCGAALMSSLSTYAFHVEVNLNGLSFWRALAGGRHGAHRGAMGAKRRRSTCLAGASNSRAVPFFFMFRQRAQSAIFRVMSRAAELKNQS